jgi:hypothetical protein
MLFGSLQMPLPTLNQFLTFFFQNCFAIACKKAAFHFACLSAMPAMPQCRNAMHFFENVPCSHVQISLSSVYTDIESVTLDVARPN